MSGGRFSVWDAVRAAYLFAGREWAYLLSAGLMPLGLQVATALFLRFGLEDSTRIEEYLWSLPTAFLTAWYSFIEIRLFLLGERAGRLPQSPAYLADRARALQLSIITSLLFNMAMAAALALLLTLGAAGQWAGGWPLRLGSLFLLGGMIWGLRFAVAPILAAVHYPLRPVLRRMGGMLFSFRLLGMGALCALPLVLALQFFLTLVVRQSPSLEQGLQLTAAQQILFSCVFAVLSLALTTLLNAALAHALRQMLGGRSRGPA